ncbi:MAG: peptidase M23 [Candidatus Moranbacteria bacterium GW2011_GWE1_35_17]|nr:MAG: peptidase M23 [Candidatus Moranbacteria bacterium GW2011_GWE2_35_164]KKP68753.1 MAG: peptidase M23 [Candidatus Moranbacteria bacterium GW2011_GWE1_35_17]KKP82944.1 MAG: peptidase M23 [Candidatus Moranbacteria bacterium GW2011_GWF1_35_5]KKP83060.1 MAG: peptidase M23 [Candidatus Moranbacteria bacterium GW2011_GWF2_35_54]
MKRFILVTLFLSFFGFISSAFAFDPPFPLPYTYNGVTFDSFIEIDQDVYTGKIQAYYSGNCQNLDYPANPRHYSGNIHFCGYNLLIRSYAWGGQYSAWQFTPNTFFASTENYASVSSSLSHSSRDVVEYPNFSGCGEDNINNCTVWKTVDVFPDKALSITRSPEVGGGVKITPPLGLPYYYCGIGSYMDCEFDVDYNAQVTLEAQANDGYAFSHWVINSQTMGDTDGTIPISMSEDKNVVAVFYLDMKLPLSGGKSWLLSVEAGGQRQCNLGVDSYHTDTGYYAFDFTDNTSEDGHLEGTDVPIRAALGGFVDFAGGDPNDNGWGYNVVIDHGNGYKTRYAHLKDAPTVSGTIQQGDQVGIMGDTGNSYGIHLHFQIYYENDSSLSNEGIVFVRLENSALGGYQVGCNEFYLSTNN